MKILRAKTKETTSQTVLLTAALIISVVSVAISLAANTDYGFVGGGIPSFPGICDQQAWEIQNVAEPFGIGDNQYELCEAPPLQNMQPACCSSYQCSWGGTCEVLKTTQTYQGDNCQTTIPLIMSSQNGNDICGIFPSDNATVVSKETACIPPWQKKSKQVSWGCPITEKEVAVCQSPKIVRTMFDGLVYQMAVDKKYGRPITQLVAKAEAITASGCNPVCPVGYSEWGGFCCHDSKEKKVSYLHVKKFCSRLTCASGEKICAAKNRNSCCPVEYSCGKGTIYGAEVGVCIPPDNSNTCKPGLTGERFFCGTTNVDGKNVCCSSSENCVIKNGVPLCAPKTCPAGQELQQGTGDNKDLQVCCPLGKGFLHPGNGIPFCKE